MIKTIIAFLCLLMGVFQSIAQKGGFSKHTFLLEQTSPAITLKYDDFISEFYIQCESCDVSSIYYSLNGGIDWTAFQQFQENDNPISTLVFLPHNTHTSVRIKSTLTQEVHFTVQHLTPFHQTFSAEQFRNLCEKPLGVLQSEWRQGLPEPRPNRTGSPTRHIVLHHSGADNFRDNYTDVVRAYYLFHVEGNQWSDIGYNYLIDPNGILYYGRDPLDSGYDQDEVRGAHFCGKNENTMGVCIIGNYDDTEPTQASLSKLIELLVWKVAKDGFDFLGNSPHPYPTGPDLLHFASHNLGCSTLCPGVYLLAQMENLSSKVMQGLSECISTSYPLLVNRVEIYPNPALENLTIEGRDFYIKIVHIYHENGRQMATLLGNPDNQIRINIHHWEPGLYTLLISNGKEWVAKKILKL
jgi:hypothetical protein